MNLAKRHLPGLDGVRGIAILMVMLLHFFTFDPTNTFEKLWFTLCSKGTLGVDLFFVLSGFLITRILLAAKDKPNYFKNFYARRSLRIFPLYYGVLIVAFCIIPFIPYFAGPTLEKMQDKQAWAWLYGINFLVASEGQWDIPYISHFWSLAVEEHFYLFWPLAVYMLNGKRLAYFCIALVVGSLLLNLGLAYYEFSPLVAYTITPSRIGGMCLGALLSIYADRANARNMSMVLLAGILLKVAADFTVAKNPDLYMMFSPARELSWYLGFTALVYFAAASDEKTWFGRALTVKPLIELGKYSYGLYVFHHIVSYGFHANGVQGQILKIIPNHTAAVFAYGAIGMVISYVIAVLSFHFFEKRFLAIKVKFENNPTVPAKTKVAEPRQVAATELAPITSPG